MKITSETRTTATGFGYLVGLGSLALAFMAAFTGERWWLRILIVAVGPLIADGITSRRALRGERVVVTASGQPDATVGQPSSLWLSVQGPAEPFLVGLPRLRIWVRVQNNEAGHLDVIYPERARLSELPVRVIRTGSFGLVGAERNYLVALDSPVFVAPMGERPREGFRPPESPNDDVDNLATRLNQAALVRGARQYQPGDRMRHVHWPATARTNGPIMVREFDALASRRLIIVVDLGHPAWPAEGERVARHARWLCDQALQQRLDLILVTVEQGRTIWAPAYSATEAQRRLATAGAGAPTVRWQRRATGLVLLDAHGRGSLPCVWVSTTGVLS